MDDFNEPPPLNMKTRRKSKKRKYETEIEGGVFEIINKINLSENEPSSSSSSSSSYITPMIRGALDDKLTWYMRQYLDMAMSSALFAMASIEDTHFSPTASSLSKGSKKTRIGYRDITAAIPGTVYNILRYNGFQFDNIGFYPKSVDIHEPIWYLINIRNNSLVLFINESMINEFCATAVGSSSISTTGNNDHLVVIEPNDIKLSAYNLQLGAIKRDQERFIPAAIKLMILCDHVSQHILSELYNPNIPQAAKIHDHQYFRKCGTTLHSMLKLTQYVSQNTKNSFFSSTPASSSASLLQTTNLITNQCASAAQYTNYINQLANV